MRVLGRYVGSAIAHQRDDLPNTKHRIPPHALPQNMPPEVKQQLAAKHIPDMMLHKPRTHNKPASYTIIEIKYCRDTDPAPQTQAAIAQHAPLVQAIRQYDPTADTRVVPIPLGVAGYVYKTTTYAMQRHLGLPRTQARTLARRLHIHAVKSLTSIIGYRRQREPKYNQDKKRRTVQGRTAYNWRRRKKKRT